MTIPIEQHPNQTSTTPAYENIMCTHGDIATMEEINRCPRCTAEKSYHDAQAARIAELEARYQADLAQFLAYQKRVDELEAALKYTRDLLRTSLCPDAIGLTPLEWANHRINKAAGELTEALEKKS